MHATYFAICTPLVLAASLITAKYSGASETTDPAINQIISTYLNTYDRIVTTRDSTLHWHKFVSVFVSRDGERYRRNVKRVETEREGDVIDPYELYEPGTVVIKEHRDTIDGDVVGWFFMIRQPTVTPPVLGGPWRYIEIDQKGAIKLDGNGSKPHVAERCATCHEETAERDYIFHTFADAPKDANATKKNPSTMQKMLNNQPEK
jgi:hypothetical protein